MSLLTGNMSSTSTIRPAAYAFITDYVFHAVVALAH